MPPRPIRTAAAQQLYDAPATEGPSVPHLGEGEAWKSPSRGRLACPPRAFSWWLPAICFFSNSKLYPIFELLSDHLSKGQSHGHETTRAPASTASTTAASSHRRSPSAESVTRALFAWPPAWRGIVSNCKSRPARERCNQRIGCCSPVRCIALRTAALLYCFTA